MKNVEFHVVDFCKNKNAHDSDSPAPAFAPDAKTRGNAIYKRKTSEREGNEVSLKDKGHVWRESASYAYCTREYIKSRHFSNLEIEAVSYGLA